MNFSDATLHIIGSRAVPDEHKNNIVETVELTWVTYPSARSDFAQYFKVRRMTAEHLVIGFRTIEGADSMWPPISCAVTNTQTLNNPAAGPPIIALLTWVNESEHYTQRYATIRIDRGRKVGELHLPFPEQMPRLAS